MFSFYNVATADVMFYIEIIAFIHNKKHQNTQYKLDARKF